MHEILPLKTQIENPRNRVMLIPQRAKIVVVAKIAILAVLAAFAQVIQEL